MLEKKSMEHAELYVLGMLPEESVRRFEHELKRNDDLQVYLSELEDTVAAVALTAPQIGPPIRVFDAIEDRIESGRIPMIRRLPIPIWAAAALVLLSGVTVQQIFSNQSHKKELAQLRSEMENGEADREQITKIRDRIRRASGREVTVDEIENVITLASKNSYKSYTLTQNLGRLEKALSRLQKAQDEIYTVKPGVSRMVVTKMLSPELAGEEKERRFDKLSKEVSDIMVSGLDEMATPAEEMEPEDRTLVLSGDDNRLGSDIVIKDGAVDLSVFDLGDRVVTHENFQPDENRGLMQLPDDQYYDKHNRILWKPGQEGLYHGMQVDERPTFDNIPEFPEPQQPEPENQEDFANPPLDPEIYTIYNQSTQEGQMVGQNLPALGDGEAYQFWVTHPEDGTAISLGVTEEFPGGSGVFDFVQPIPDISPTNFKLTLEPSGGSDTPTGPLILVGPE